MKLSPSHIIKSSSQLSRFHTKPVAGLEKLWDPHLLLEVLNLTLQLLNRLLQLRNLDFGFLHAVPVKLGRCLKFLVLRRDRGSTISRKDPHLWHQDHEKSHVPILFLFTSSFGIWVKHDTRTRWDVLTEVQACFPQFPWVASLLEKGNGHAHPALELQGGY